MQRFTLSDLITQANRFLKLSQDNLGEFAPEIDFSKLTGSGENYTGDDPDIIRDRAHNKVFSDELKKKLTDFAANNSNTNWKLDKDKVAYRQSLIDLIEGVNNPFYLKDQIKSEFEDIERSEASITQKDQANFVSKERSDMRANQNASSSDNEGKSPLTNQDAIIMIRSHTNEIKSLITRIKAPNTTARLTFYYNGNVGFSSANQKLAAALRNELNTPLQLALKTYTTNNKKYFASQTVSVVITIDSASSSFSLK